MSKFAISIYEPNRKQQLVKCKDSLQILKEMRKEFPILQLLLTHKGRPKLDGEWTTINEDSTAFSKKYPYYLFELRRVEKATVEVLTQENIVTGNEEKILVTIFQVLNGSINLQTFSGKESKNEQQKI